MSIAAIPTIYRNVQFRSRLEARWAAFFTLAEWDWHYEPIDLNGWIPDFVIIGKKGNTIYVEIKPILWNCKKDDNGSNKFDTSKIWDFDDLDKVFANVVDSDGEILVIGANILFDPFKFTNPNTGYAFIGSFIYPIDLWDGIYGDSGESDGYFELDPATLFTGYQHPLDLTAHYNSWTYRIGGEKNGKHHLIYPDLLLIERLWAEAGNSVQWRRPRR